MSSKKIKNRDGKVVEALLDVPNSINIYDRLLNGRAPVGIKQTGVFKGQSDIINFILPSGSTIVPSGSEMDVTISSTDNSFIFRPGGVAAGNVYTDFALLKADHDIVDGPKIIYLDDSVSPITIPANTYDFSNTLLKKFAPPNYPTMGGSATNVTVSNGVVFTNNRLLVSGLTLRSFSVTPVLTMDATSGLVLLLEGAELETAATSPFLSKTAGASPANIYIDKGRFITGSNPVITTTGTSAIIDIWLFNEGIIEQDSLASADAGDAVNIHIKSPSASYSSIQSGITGTITVTYENYSHNVSFDPTIEGVLTEENVQGAIDELTTLIGGGGGVIPRSNTYTPTPAQTNFNLSFIPSGISTFFLTVNGIGYDYITDYSILGNVLTWAGPFPLESTDSLSIYYFS